MFSAIFIHFLSLCMKKASMGRKGFEDHLELKDPQEQVPVSRSAHSPSFS